MKSGRMILKKLFWISTINRILILDSTPSIYVFILFSLSSYWYMIGRPRSHWLIDFRCYFLVISYYLVHGWPIAVYVVLFNLVRVALTLSKTYCFFSLPWINCDQLILLRFADFISWILKGHIEVTSAFIAFLWDI